MSSVTELEAEVAATRERLHSTIDRIQDKLTVSGLVDEFMGQAGVPKMESGQDFLLGLIRRHPVPVMIAAAGLGFFFYRMNKRDRQSQLPRIETELAGTPLLPPAHTRNYDLDRAPQTHTLADVADTRHVDA